MAFQKLMQIVSRNMEHVRLWQSVLAARQEAVKGKQRVQITNGAKRQLLQMSNASSNALPRTSKCAEMRAHLVKCPAICLLALSRAVQSKPCSFKGEASEIAD